MLPTQDIVEDMPMLIEPTSAGRRGLMPELHSLPSFREETEYLKNRVQQIYNQLQQAQIPVEWVNANSASRDYKPAAHSIKLMTMHSSKGLEFSVVFIPGLGYLPNQHSTLAMESRLLYVAMTRAIRQLVLTCHQNSDFTVKIQSALEKAALTIF